jgi:O-antigen ligase
MNNKTLNIYFLLLFSLIPVSIIFGPAISLINILLIDFSFIFLIFYKKDFKFFSDKTVKFIILFCLYLIFNFIISKDMSINVLRSFGFIRFGILFLAFNYFFYNKNFTNKVLIVWIITLSVLMVDTYIERIFGKNILGYGERYGERIVSFFKDEPIVGGYINGFFLIIIGYLFSLNKQFINKYKNVILIFSLFLLVAILLTGERSNSIKAFFGFVIFYFFNDFFRSKEKFFFSIIVFLAFIFLVIKSDYLNKRYVGQFLKPIIYEFIFNNEIKKDKIKETSEFRNNTYIKLYQSGFSIFKNYPVFGIGNKNYRIEACKNKKDPTYVCNSHPHQIYFEFLAEHGLVGTMILLFILFNLIFSKIKIILVSKNYLQIGCLIFLLISFIPFLPSGAFFSDYNLNIFWLNLSIMYSVGKKTNVYT